MGASALSTEQHRDGTASLSIRKEVAGSVLVTGGLGFLGSVVLEQLLRNCTQVKHVYLLVRGKKNLTAAQRVEKLLCGALFTMLHKQVENGGSNVFLKVQAIEGDLCMPGLGLSQADEQLLLSDVQHVIHCAANIELDADIQRSLRHNYFGTQALLALASRMQQVRSFVHVSTYFVNNHMPRNSVVKEQLHPLPLVLNGRSVGHAEFVEGLMSMDNEEANKTALDLMAQHKFNSTYAFGKHLTEMMVVNTPVRPGVQTAIVRPSLISALLGDPYPGYVFGYGGPSGYTMGYAVGFFQGAFSVAFASDYIMDLIPCDVVAALTIAAAAKASSVFGTDTAKQVPIYHACSGHCNPVTLATVFDCCSKFWKLNQPPLTLPGTMYPVFEQEHQPHEWGIALGRCIAWIKIIGLSALLQAIGKTREAKALKNAYTAFSVYNTRRYDRSILSTVDNAYGLRSQLSREEAQLFTLVADASKLSWYPYGYTMFAGVRRLLFRQESESTTEVAHSFSYRPPAASSAVLRLDDVAAGATVDVVAGGNPSCKDQAAKPAITVLAEGKAAAA